MKSPKQNFFQRVSNAAWPLRGQPSSNHAVPTAAALACLCPCNTASSSTNPPPSPRHESVRPTSRWGQGSPERQECTGSAQTHATRGVHCCHYGRARVGTSSVYMLHGTRERLQGWPLYGTLKADSHITCRAHAVPLRV